MAPFQIEYVGFLRLRSPIGPMVSL